MIIKKKHKNIILERSFTWKKSIFITYLPTLQVPRYTAKSTVATQVRLWLWLWLNLDCGKVLSLSIAYLPMIIVHGQNLVSHGSQPSLIFSLPITHLTVSRSLFTSSTHFTSSDVLATPVFESEPLLSGILSFSRLSRGNHVGQEIRRHAPHVQFQWSCEWRRQRPQWRRSQAALSKLYARPGKDGCAQGSGTLHGIAGEQSWRLRLCLLSEFHEHDHCE